MSGIKFYVGGRANGKGLAGSLIGIDRVVSRWAQAQVGRIQQAFRSGGHGSRGGQQWAAWSPAYAKNRVKRGRTNILLDTGVLRQSIHSKTAVGDGSVQVTIGTNLKYAKAHQYGHTFDKAKVRAHRQYRAKLHKKALKRQAQAQKSYDKATQDAEKARRLRREVRKASGRDKSQAKSRKKHIQAARKKTARKVELNEQLRIANENASQGAHTSWIKAGRRSGIIPARPIIVFTTSDKEDLSSKLNAFLEAQVSQARRRA